MTKRQAFCFVAHIQYNDNTMIRTLTGTITDIGDNWVVVDVRGVGYLVGCPTLANNFTLEQSVKLQTYLAVRETALDPIWFPEKSELQMFELLLSVPKVGPKSALAIMTQATPLFLVRRLTKMMGYTCTSYLVSARRPVKT